jgi:hypothetical protein
MFNVGVSPKAVAAMLVVFGVVGAILYHVAVVARCDAKVADLDKRLAAAMMHIEQVNSALDASMDTNRRFSALVVEQNNKISSLEKLADQRQQLAEAALAQARKQREKQVERYQPIVTGKPDNAADICGSLETRLRQYLAARNAERVK